MVSRRTLLGTVGSMVPLAAAGCAALESDEPEPAITDLHVDQTGETGAWTVDQIQAATPDHPPAIELRFENTLDRPARLSEGQYFPFSGLLEEAATPDGPPAPVVLNPWYNGGWVVEPGRKREVWQIPGRPYLTMLAKSDVLEPGERVSRRYQVLVASTRGLSPEPGAHTFRSTFHFSAEGREGSERAATLTVQTA